MRDLKILVRPSPEAGRTAVEHAMKTGARLTTRASTQVFTSPRVALEALGGTIWGPLRSARTPLAASSRASERKKNRNTWEELCDKRDQMIAALLKATAFVPQV